jgi:hypothetical protein
VLLPTRNRKALLHGEVDQLPVLVGINHHKELAVSPNTLLIHDSEDHPISFFSIPKETLDSASRPVDKRFTQRDA